MMSNPNWDYQAQRLAESLTEAWAVLNEMIEFLSKTEVPLGKAERWVETRRTVWKTLEEARKFRYDAEH